MVENGSFSLWFFFSAVSKYSTHDYYFYNGKKYVIVTFYF